MASARLPQTSCDAAAGNAKAAEQGFLQALALARQVKDRNNEPQILVHLARLYFAVGRLAEARAQLEAALPMVESVRAGLLSHEFRATYVASKRQLYTTYVDVLMALHRANPAAGFSAAALEASERARARTLLDALGEATARIREGAAPDLLLRERRLQQLLQAKVERHIALLSSRQTEPQAAAFGSEIEHLRAELRDAEIEIRRSSPRYAELVNAQPLRASEIQQMLDDETLLLEYWLGEEQGYVWAVTRTSIASFNLRPRAQIDAAAREAYNLLITPPSRRPTTASEVDAAIDALSRMILDDPLAGISRRTRLLVVADGALHYIPFTALTVPTSGSDTIARVSVIGIHEIVSLPSASIIAGLRRDLSNRPLAPRTVAVVADPVFDAHDSRVRRHNPRATPASGASSAGSSAWAGALARSATDVGTRGSGDGLPRLVFSRREAQAIVGLVSPGEGLQALDFAASRATVTGGALRDYRVVHIATHGFLNPVHPELSGVVLSLVDQRGVPQDGFLQLHDIYNLRLVAELVVLSACQTGVGAEIWGEGLVGLTRGVMYAGARASSSASGELTMKRRRS